MNLSTLKKTLIGLFILIVLIAIILVIVNIRDSNFDAITYISGLSTFSVSILTLLYVYTTSAQLSVMNKQLEEMKKERELQHQPLPWISKVKVRIEPPKLFFSPPENEHSVQSRYFCSVIVKNVGTYPSICNDISAQLIIPQNNEEPMLLGSTSIRINTLEEKQIYPSCDDEKSSFLFAADNEGKFFEALLSDIMEHPVINLRILFKNTSGGYFIAYSSYALAIPEEKEPVIKTFFATIKTFPIKYSHELNRLQQLKEDRSDKWYELFSKLNEELACSDEKEIEELDLNVVPIPDSFIVKDITNEEYDNMASMLSYGIPHALLKKLSCKK